MPSMHMTKVPEYPRPHDWSVSFAMPVESAASLFATQIPLITYDEGLGAMSAYESNPTNAAFVEAATDHCFPSSRINSIFCKLEVHMSKIMLETDKLHVVKFQTALIHTVFDEAVQAKDEVSTLDLEEILELQSEATDRQTYPLYNAADLKDYKANSLLDMPAETPGLDTDLELEGVDFSDKQYYDCLAYHTTGHKLRSICTPLRTHVLTKDRPFKTLFFNQQSNTKFMNPYAYLGLLIANPQMLNEHQFGQPTDSTIETCTLEYSLHCRYNEFNHEFNHSML